jgi:allantoinase
LFDTAIRADGLQIGITDGRIESVAAEVGPAREEIDARSLAVLPGIIDVHLHFNEPGRTDWEGAATGSRALAAGGGTTFFDMPLNSTPCTTNATEFERKRAALAAASITDFGLWGGLVPGNLADLAELAAAGAIGFKAFMSNSGLPEFARADDVTLLEGMAEAARLGLPVAVHAESEEITSILARRALTGVRDFLTSRPIIAELEAISRACLFAEETRVKLHIVHISSGRGVALAAEARARGVDVSIETCPHYLFFTEEDVERIGVAAKCAPPIRNQHEQDALWTALRDGTIDIVASDHSPAPPERKSGDFLRAWGGIAGVQSTLSVLLERQLPLDRIATVLAAKPAERFRIAWKGHIAPGYDADLTLVDLSRSERLEHLHQRHAMSPYLGTTFRGVVRRTIRRGETIFADSAITARTSGKLITCNH